MRQKFFTSVKGLNDQRLEGDSGCHFISGVKISAETQEDYKTLKQSLTEEFPWLTAVHLVVDSFF